VAAASRHKQDLAAYGFTLRPLSRSLAYAAIALVVILPTFAIGYVAFHEHFCMLAQPAAMCQKFAGFAGLAHPRLPDGFADLVLGQLVLAAIPEELFFRGYLLELLEQAYPPRRRFLGGGVGVALVVSASLFALSHVLFGLSPARVVTFFPGLLFGWLRSATRSIIAGVIVHTSSNLAIAILQRTLFP